jgi:hypothetical protein
MSVRFVGKYLSVRTSYHDPGEEGSAAFRSTGSVSKRDLRP